MTALWLHGHARLLHTAYMDSMRRAAALLLTYTTQRLELGAHVATSGARQGCGRSGCDETHRALCAAAASLARTVGGRVQQDAHTACWLGQATAYLEVETLAAAVDKMAAVGAPAGRARSPPPVRRALPCGSSWPPPCSQMPPSCAGSPPRLPLAARLSPPACERPSWPGARSYDAVRT